MIQAFPGFVIVIYVQHRLLDALFFEVDEAFCANCFTDSLACLVGVNTDDIELTDRVLVNEVAMDLGPAETCNLSIVNS